MATPRLCSIPGCDKRHEARGFCKTHYARLRRGNDPYQEPKNLYAEHYAYMLEHMHGDCPKWPFRCNFYGYGVATNGEFIHRMVCELVNGPPPTPKHEAAHGCGEGSAGCFGAGCLEWKTRAENEADKTIHGTHNRGERHGAARLTKEDVLKIRSLKGSVSQSKLAARYGVAQPYICQIQSRKTWAWL